MDTTSTPDLLARRLERLRAAQPSRPMAAPPAASGRGTRARAQALADGLGGRLEETPGGPLVVIERVVCLPLARESLAGLPFSVPGDGPLLCLDLETTGLGTGTGTLPFLVGLGTWQGADLLIRQLVLPDHADEADFLAALSSILPDNSSLVTYNGRSFDWPLLVARFRLHRREPPLPGSHLDLLPIARTLWRHRLGNARLATVESAICAVQRRDDLPGALVPERYFRFLRNGRPEELREVVEHNREDILTLGRLLQVLARQVALRDGWQEAHPGDLAGLARAYVRRGRHLEALDCLQAALDSEAWRRGVVGGAAMHRRLETERALTLARLGRQREAQGAWLAIAQRGGPGSALAWLKVARHREHHERDIEGALEAAQQASMAAARARAAWGRPETAVERDLSWRLWRLRRKLAAQRDTLPGPQPEGRLMRPRIERCPGTPAMPVASTERAAASAAT